MKELENLKMVCSRGRGEVDQQLKNERRKDSD